MFIRLGYEIGISCSQPTPMMTFLSVDRARRHDIVSERGPISDPVVKMGEVTDPFGNVCMRMVVPAGGLRLSYDAVIRDSGRPAGCGSTRAITTVNPSYELPSMPTRPFDSGTCFTSQSIVS